MAFYDKFPYTNFQDLNIDFLMEEIKRIDTVEGNAQKYAEQAEASATSAGTNAQEAAAAATAAAATMAQASEILDKVDETEQTYNRIETQVESNTERIDNILVSGTPTEGNAELIDIRVGANGVTYSTAGQAVRAQVNALQNEFYQFNNGVIPFNTTWQRGAIGVDGAIQSNVTWRLTSGMMNTGKYTIVKLSTGYTGQIATYNNGGQFIARKTLTDNYPIPAGTYFRLSVYRQNEQTSDNPDTFYLYINQLTSFSNPVTGTEQNIIPSTVQQICGNDFNNLPNNKIYACSISDATTANIPNTDLRGLVVTLGKQEERTTGDIQIFYYVNGKSYWRRYWGDTWYNWIENASGADYSNIEQSVNKYVETVYPEQYSNRLVNVTENVIFVAANNQWIDAPFQNAPISSTGIFTNTRYSYNYQIQRYTLIGTATNTWERITDRSGNIFRDWVQVNGVQPVKILALGDSICSGYRNSGKGFVGDLGLPYKNIGVSGATLTNIVTDVQNIPDQLIAETSYNPDVIIANGGINDYLHGATLGTVPTRPARNSTDAAGLDRTTVTGALGYLFYTMISKFPKAQRYFVIVHKMYYPAENMYYPDMLNASNPRYTFTQMHDVMIQMCKLYNVEVIDVFNDGIINTLYDAYRSDVSYDDDPSVTDTDYVDSDGIHPLAYGYKQCYIPLIRKALATGTNK